MNRKGYRFAAEVTIECDAEPVLEQEPSDPTQNRVVPTSDQHFVSIVHGVDCVNAEDAEIAHGRVLAFSNACHEIAVGYGCHLVVLPGSGVTILAGFSKPTEQPAKVSILVATDMLDSAQELARRERHLKVAETLRDHSPQVAASEPELIAIHYAASTEPGHAAEYWQAAGEASVEKHAVAEARALFRQALDVARTTPKGNETAALVAKIEAMLAAF